MHPSSDQEIELKLLLRGEGAADRLARALGRVTSDRLQLNYVIDTEDFALNRHQYALRVRNEDGRHTLTAKGPSRQLGGYVSVRTEAEAGIALEVALQIRSGQRDAIAALREQVTDGRFAALWMGLDAVRAGKKLREIGQFSNRRRTIPVVLPTGQALIIELDQTRLPDGRLDEEVEIELSNVEQVSVVEEWLESIAATVDVEMVRSTAKLARFYAAIS